MARLDKSNLSTLSRQMELIAATFFNSKKYQSETENKLFDIEGGLEENQYTTYISRVEETYRKLNPLEQLFINNDYFYQNYPFWWMEIFSRTTYYRYKKKALIHFLRLFYDE